MKEIWKDIELEDLEGEVWKSLDFIGFPNYEISSLGRVKSLNYHREKKPQILKLQLDCHGYPKIILWKNCIGKKFLVHRLVAFAFLPNPENKPYIDHKNCIRTDGRVSNLHWVSQKENQNNPLTRKHISEWQIGDKGSMWGRFGKQHPRYKTVIQLTLEGEYVNTWYGVREAGRILNINASSISACCRGQLNQTAGFKWQYA